MKANWKGWSGKIFEIYFTPISTFWFAFIYALIQRYSISGVFFFCTRWYFSVSRSYFFRNLVPLTLFSSLSSQKIGSITKYVYQTVSRLAVCNLQFNSVFFIFILFLDFCTKKFLEKNDSKNLAINYSTFCLN